MVRSDFHPDLLCILLVIAFFNWPTFQKLEPNAWGDFLAGSIGLLVLFWLILGFFLQSSELRNSVEALKLQANELSASVEQQKNLVNSAESAAKLETSRYMSTLRLEAQKNSSEIEIQIYRLPEQLKNLDDTKTTLLAYKGLLKSGAVEKWKKTAKEIEEHIQALTNSYGELPPHEKCLDQEDLGKMVGDLFDLKVRFLSIEYQLKQLSDSISKDREIYTIGRSRSP